MTLRQLLLYLLAENPGQTPKQLWMAVGTHGVDYAHSSVKRTLQEMRDAGEVRSVGGRYTATGRTIGGPVDEGLSELVNRMRGHLPVRDGLPTEDAALLESIVEKGEVTPLDDVASTMASGSRSELGIEPGRRAGEHITIGSVAQTLGVSHRVARRVLEVLERSGDVVPAARGWDVAPASDNLIELWRAWIRRTARLANGGVHPKAAEGEERFKRDTDRIRIFRDDGRFGFPDQFVILRHSPTKGGKAKKWPRKPDPKDGRTDDEGNPRKFGGRRNLLSPDHAAKKYIAVMTTPIALLEVIDVDGSKASIVPPGAIGWSVSSVRKGVESRHYYRLPDREFDVWLYQDPKHVDYSVKRRRWHERLFNDDGSPRPAPVLAPHVARGSYAARALDFHRLAWESAIQQASERGLGAGIGFDDPRAAALRDASRERTT